MATINRFVDIAAWKMGRELVREIYLLTGEEPFSKDWGLRDQIRRAAVSICSNIAEGFERNGNKEFVNFLWIAKGSAGEVSSQLYHALDCEYINLETFNSLQDKVTRIGVVLFKLIIAIKSSRMRGVKYKQPNAPMPPMNQ